MSSILPHFVPAEDRAGTTLAVGIATGILQEARVDREGGFSLKGLCDLPPRLGQAICRIGQRRYFTGNVTKCEPRGDKYVVSVSFDPEATRELEG